MKKLLLLLTLSAFTLAGCTSPVSAPLPKEVAKQATYPTAPTKAQVLNYFRATLRDYDTAKFENWILYRAYIRTNPPTFVHMVSVDVNGKNAYGGYTGFQRYSLIVHGNGSVRDALPGAGVIELVDIVDMAEK